MSLRHENPDLAEKHDIDAPSYAPATGDLKHDGHFDSDPENLAQPEANKLHQDLKGRHMQMIAMQVQRAEPSTVY
jgi:amino acid permease